MTPAEALARATGTLALIADGRGPAREMAQAALDAIEQAAEAADREAAGGVGGAPESDDPSAAADLDVEALAAALMNTVGKGWLRTTPSDPALEWIENARIVAAAYAAAREANVTVNSSEAWCDECRTVHPLHLPVLLRDTPEDRERLAAAIFPPVGPADPDETNWAIADRIIAALVADGSPSATLDVDVLAAALDAQDDRTYCHHNATGILAALRDLGYEVRPIEPDDALRQSALNSDPEMLMEDARLYSEQQAAEAADREAAGPGSERVSANATSATADRCEHPVDFNGWRMCGNDRPCEEHDPPSAAAIRKRGGA